MAEELAPGEVSDPVRGVGGYRVLVLHEREPGSLAPFEEVRSQVRAEYLRSLGERSLRDYLEALRESAAIEIRESEFGVP